MASLSRNRLVAVPAAIACVAVLLFVAIVPFTDPGLNLEEGDTVSRTIRAPRDISIVSQSLTEERQDEAADAVEDTLAYDPGVAVAQQARLNTLLVRIRNILEDPNLTPVTRSVALDRVDNLDLSPANLTLLSSLPPGAIETIETESRRALAALFESSLPDDLVRETRDNASSFVSPNVDREMAQVVGEVIRPFIVTNLVVDKAKSEASRDAARASVAPVQVSFARNQVILEEDETVTPEAYEALLEAGIIGSAWRTELLGSSALLAMVAAGVLAAGWNAFRPSGTALQLVALGLVVALPVFLLKVYMPLVLPDDDRQFFVFILPAAVAAMVLAGFIGAEVAFLAAALTALLSAFTGVLLIDVTVAGIAGPLDVARIGLVTGIAGAAGVFALRNADNLVRFSLAGLAIAVTVFLTLGAAWLLDPEHGTPDLPWLLGVSVANGVLSAVLGAGIFVTLCSLFGTTTRLQLLELSQLSQPLLLRLQDEAPSTFQHSVIVANLAEKGAHVIGADSLLARVGCYYHDIGKLIRPGFFIENQLGGANPHDALDPMDSARIISDHVRDGLTLARQHRLPPKVAAFIPEHHGTRVVLYFYRQAVQEDPDVDADAFRYPGPKPQSRETAIAMLADSTEATVRSSADKSPERIDAIVDDIFSERLADGQLDDCDLTLRNLRALAASFKATLRAVYHPRVEYPAPSEAELLLRRLPFRAAK
jgi:putative nucleotidyltransferase with HDIG domain